MFKKYFLTVIVILFFACQVFAGEGWIGAETKYWMSELSANIRSSTTAIVGHDINLIGDLGVSKDEDIPEIEVYFKLGAKNKLSVSYLDVEHSGTKAITTPINYSGQTYIATDTVSSKLETTMLEVTLERDILYNALGKAGLTLGIKYMDIQGSLSSTLGGTRSESINGAIPVIGVVIEINPLKQLTICVEGNAIKVNTGDVNGSLVDITAGVKYNFNDYWHVFGGYRYFDIGVESGDDKADITLKGPVVSLIGSF